MRILSKKRFAFKAQDERFVSQGGMIIEDAPDWIAKMPLFHLAVADGDIVTVQTPVTKAVNEAPKAAPKAEPKAEPEKEVKKARAAAKK